MLTALMCAGIASVGLNAEQSTAVILRNGSFEEPQLGGEGKQATNVIPGWKTSGAAGIFANNGAYGNKMEGTDREQLAYLNGTKAGALIQDVSGRIAPNTVYALSVGIGLRKDTPLTNGASLLLRLQAFDTNKDAVIRTLAIKEITVGKETLSDSKLTEFGVSFATSAPPPAGGLRVMISVGEKSAGSSGDWTIDNVWLETKLAATVPFRNGVARTVASAASKGKKSVHYNRDIRPILSENCFACHGPDSASRKAGLRLDRFEEATATRKDVTAIVPGKPERSALIARIFTADDDDVMPPTKTKKKLTSQQKELLRTWIAEGAEYELHWSFIAPERPALPPVKNTRWVRNPVDRFVLARLEKEGLQPAPEADRRTLARRLSLDLTGLPPSPADVEEFVKDRRSDAYDQFVDRLMASEHWGEHRGRYWLDVARYADTHGIHFDNFREMWAYRDWVIKAFNANMPFDRFTIEQLAGDLLPNRTLEQQIASGFNRCNITTAEGGIIDEEYLVLYTRDRTETTSAVWMGLTAQCAVCHDHKFDPLTQREFYEMSAFFNNNTVRAKDDNRRDPPPTLVVPTSDDRGRWFALAKEAPSAKEAVDGRRKQARPDFDKWTPTAEPFAKGIPVKDLVFHAPLNEGAGTNISVSVGGEKETIELGTNVVWGSGYIGMKALKSSSNVVVAFTNVGDFDKDQAFSCATWIKLPKDGMSGAALGRMDDRNGYRGWDLFINDGRPATHLVSAWPSNAVKVIAKDKLTAGQWTHVVLSYDGSAKPEGVKFFINGKASEVEVPNKGLTNSIRTSVPLKLAQRDTSSRLNLISLQDVRLYKRALKAKDAENLAKGTRAAWLAQKPKRTTDESNELFDRWLMAVDKPYQEVTTKLASLEAEETGIKKRGTVAHVFEERPEEAMAYILNRGEYDRRRDRVLAHTPDIMPPMPEGFPRNRLGFAQWLLLPEHPLTARVAVNRYWQELFGTGLVRTSGDFGVAGELPSHPELLDWLAVEFRESGWDVKRFFKMLVSSAAYRQATLTTPEKLEKDPQNRLLSRGPRFRMDAEMVRDYALAASSLLVRKIGGPSVKPYQPPGVWEAVAMQESNTRKYERDSGDKLYRRSLYTFWKRSAPPASMDVFNAPSRETCTVRRERTDTPLQALVTLNDPQFIEAARHLAELALEQGGTTVEGRLDFVARRLLTRSLRAPEEKIAEAVLKDLLAYYQSAPSDAEALIGIGESKLDGSLKKPELAAYTMAVNQLMNLDEVLNK